MYFKFLYMYLNYLLLFFNHYGILLVEIINVCNPFDDFYTCGKGKGKKVMWCYFFSLVLYYIYVHVILPN